LITITQLLEFIQLQVVLDIAPLNEAQWRFTTVEVWLIGTGYSTAAQASDAHCPRNGLWTRSYAANRHTLRPNQPIAQVQLLFRINKLITITIKISYTLFAKNLVCAGGTLKNYFI